MTHDPFKEKAEREAAKRAGKGAPGKVVAAPAPTAVLAAATDHFAPKRKPPVAPVFAPAVERVIAEPVEAQVTAPVVEARKAVEPAVAEASSDRILSNGAPLKMVRSDGPAVADAVARERKPAGRASSMVLVSSAASGAALATMADAPADEIDKPAEPAPAAEPAPVEAPPVTPSPAAPAPVVSEPVAATPAPSAAEPTAEAAAVKPVKPGGGSGGGGGRGGSGGGEAVAAREKLFDQDDLVSVLLVIGMVLIALLMFFQSKTSKAPADDRIVSPQMAANVAPPAPLPPDPFGDAPGDLTPKSPLPEAAPAPVTETPAMEAPEKLQETPPAPPPAPSVAQPVIPACAPGRMVRAYFCTSKADLTPAARAALDREVTAWKACAAGRELVVTGYADTRGDGAYNTWLGGLRATTVSTILREAGLTVSETMGVGELPGLDDGKNCSNQRRVDVMLKDGTPIPPSKACAPPEDEAPIICP